MLRELPIFASQDDRSEGLNRRYSRASGRLQAENRQVQKGSAV